MMKRVLNFQKLLLGSWLVTVSPQERRKKGFITDVAAYSMLVLPFIVLIWIDGDVMPLMWSVMFPLIALTQALFKDMAIFKTLPVTRRFVAANFMLLAPVVTCAFGVLMLVFLVPMAVANIGHGVPVLDTPIQKLLIIAFVGFCLYVLCLVILMLGSKAKIAFSVLYGAGITAGVYFAHSAVPISYGQYNGDRALILTYVLKNFGFGPSLAAVVLLAALFVAAGIAVLPRLILNRGVA